MPLETATYISGLVSSNPPGSDSKGQGDDHLRLVKSVLQATFPNATQIFRFESVATKTSNATAVVGDDRAFWFVDATSAAVTITLPLGSAVNSGFHLTILRIDAVVANALSVVRQGSDTIEGGTSYAVANQRQGAQFIWDGAEWKVHPFGKILTSDVVVAADIKTFLDAATFAAARTALVVPGLATANSYTGVNTYTQRQIWSKGGDIASANPLVIDTDGNYFDVTGTTGFASLTIPAGMLFMLQFDGILTITYHATNMNLPSAANITTAVGDRLIGFATAADQVTVLDYIRADGTALAVSSVGSVGQIVNTQIGAVATGSTVLPADDTIPQNTEGDEFITRAITPQNASSILIIEVVMNLAHSLRKNMGIALFKDSDASALAGMRSSAEQFLFNMTMTHKMTAGSTSAITFKIRAGASSSGTTTFNGVGGGRIFGGVMASSITITEVLP